MALKNSQLMVVSCGLAVQAFCLVVINAFVAKLVGADTIWIAFQAWAVYFLVGCNVMGGIKAWLGYASGIAISILITKLMGLLGGISWIPSPDKMGGINLVMAIAVFIAVFPAIMSENLKNLIPCLFIGSGAFFGLSSIDFGGETGKLSLLSATYVELVYCALGLLFGWITVFWRGKYEASLSK